MRLIHRILIPVSVVAITLTAPWPEGTARADKPAFEVVSGQRQLFLDDVGIARIENLQRNLHQPRKKGAVIAPNDPQAAALQTRTAPIWDPDRRLWKMWDCTAPNDLAAIPRYCAGYYESEDGVHWTRPVVGLVERNGSKQNHFVPVRPDSGWGRPDLVVRDAADPDPARRYKSALPNMGFAVSPDGIHWTMLDLPAISSGDEYNLSLDEQEHLFLLTIKGGGAHGRSVHLVTSRDFKTWTNHGLIFHADDLDQQLGRQHIKARMANPRLQHPFWHNPSLYNVDVYNMGLFRYEGLYIGTPAMYHAVGAPPNYPNTVGFHLIQLVSSRDLKSFHRVGDRKTFIGPSPKGPDNFDALQMIGPSNAIVRDDELWFYYTGLKYRGTGELSSAEQAKLDKWFGAICMAVLRRDGFVSLDAGDTAGIVVTEPFTLPGTKLFVNVDARKESVGELRVEVLNQAAQVVARSEALRGDLLSEPVKWQEGDLAKHRGRPVTLRFTLRNGRLYSFWIE